MTNDELKAIGEEYEKTTGGDWIVAHYLDGFQEPCFFIKSQETGQIICYGDDANENYLTKDNANYIANSHSNIPALLAEVRRLQAAFDWLEENALHIAIDDGRATQISASLEYIEAAMKRTEKAATK